MRPSERLCFCSNVFQQVFECHTAAEKLDTGLPSKCGDLTFHMHSGVHSVNASLRIFSRHKLTPAAIFLNEFSTC